jgi:mono/diheme cytochrome c family protein
MGTDEIIFEETTMRAIVLQLCAAVLGLTACAVEVQNTLPAQRMAQAARPPGSVYTGWRVFQDKCAGCHGADAAGTAAAPNLLARVGDMGPQRFVNLVLRRYDWNISASQAASEGAARDALIEQILRRQEQPLSMPAWQGEPVVSAHIIDLHAYLVARSEGRQGPGRPSP